LFPTFLRRILNGQYAWGGRPRPQPEPQLGLGQANRTSQELGGTVLTPAFTFFDQDAARDFYVNKLGFEIRMDQSIDNGFRWLTVSPKGQPDFQLVLMKVDARTFYPT
jgi:hypothetical protein